MGRAYSLVKRDREAESMTVNLAPGSFRRHCKSKEGGRGRLEGSWILKRVLGTREEEEWLRTELGEVGTAKHSPRPPRDQCPRHSACAAPQSSTCGRLRGWWEKRRKQTAVFPGPVAIAWSHFFAAPRLLPPHPPLNSPSSFSPCSWNPRVLPLNNHLG